MLRGSVRSGRGESGRAGDAGASCASVSLEHSRASVTGDGGGFDPCSDWTVASPRDSNEGSSESGKILTKTISHVPLGHMMADMLAVACSTSIRGRLIKI